MGATATEQACKQFPKVSINVLKRRHQTLAALLVQFGDAAPELGDGPFKVFAFGRQGFYLSFQFLGFLFRAQIDRTHHFAFAPELFEPAFDGFCVRRRPGILDPGNLEKAFRCGVQHLDDPFRQITTRLLRLLDGGFGPDPFLARFRQS